MILPHPPLEGVLSHLKGVRKSFHGWSACCPAHSDREPSLSIALGDGGEILLKCFVGCSVERIVEAMGMTLADLFPATPSPPGSQAKEAQRHPLSILELARDKGLPWQYLFTLGITEDKEGLRIPYHLPDGTPAARHRIRTALVAREGSRWSRGKGEIVPYGLERLEAAHKGRSLILVEGESDCWTLWYHGFPALGLPGADMASKLKVAYLAEIDTLYLVREPDAAGAKLVRDIAQRLASWKWSGKAYVVSLAGTKDPNDLHKQDSKGFNTAFQQALAQAKPLLISSDKQTPTSLPTDGKPSPFPLQELLARNLPPVRWAIPDILPEGLNLLAGKPKQGKSWLALAISLAIAAGGYALGKQPVTQGQVLYLALEDNERRLQSRARQLLASMNCVPDGIEFELRWPRLDQGGLRYLEEYLKAHPQLRLVVIDTWAKVSPCSKGRQRSQYEEDYEALTPLKHLADAYRVSILAIHHLRKLVADDVLDEISGSIGVTGAVDGALILKRERGQSEAMLYVTGRDIEQDQQLALVFDRTTATWTLAGDVEEFRRTKERQAIIDVLTEQLPGGMTPRQIAEALDKNYHTTRSLLRKMEDAGEIRHANNQYFALSKDIVCNQRNQCHHRNQSVSSGQQLHSEGQLEHIQEEALTVFDDTDYADYTDYSDDADDSSSPDMATSHELAPSQVDTALQHIPLALLVKTENGQQQEGHRAYAVISVINGNHSDTPASQTTLPVGNTTGGSDAADSPWKTQAAIAGVSKNYCPHHPHARWIRFDPAGQAWCDKMECWDCYRLMKIGEALGYRPLVGPTSTIGQGIAAWSSFVTSQGSFIVATATQQAIELCKASSIEVPDLSVEVPRLVSAW